MINILSPNGSKPNCKCEHSIEENLCTTAYETTSPEKYGELWKPHQSLRRISDEVRRISYRDGQILAVFLV